MYSLVNLLHVLDFITGEGICTMLGSSPAWSSNDYGCMWPAMTNQGTCQSWF